MRGNDHGQCLTEETLTEYLEGGLDPAVKAASEVHLVVCDKCRDELAFLMRLLQPEQTAEETATVARITAEWERKKRINKVPERKHSYSGRFIALAAIAALLLIGVLSVWIIRERSAEPKSAGEVVQLLLAQNRPFEARLTNQPHLAIRRTRGSEDPGVSYGLLAGEMTRLSANSHEMGRFYLLQKEFSRAIPYLENSEREVGAGPAVHNDLGVAYFESGNMPQMEKAGTEFQHALRDDPSFAAAVFNLALFYERTNATALAEAQWKRYLQIDPNSEWAQEARERLQGLTR